jgi:hypothetical protein
MGLVENLLGPQELLNKVTSQELHVVNTTANSGWKVQTGALKNMTLEELEQRGAETGLVLELTDVAQADKIQPNQVPSGLDRISYKAEEHIKTISGVSDYQTGAAREDVSAKAVQENLKRGSLNQAQTIDSLSRSDYILARNTVSIVQRFYTEPRIVNVTHNKFTGERKQVELNMPTPEGTITNDLTLGEYDIVVTSVPHRQTMEQSQFEQSMALREAGIPIPDDVLIEHSSLYRKNDILKKMAEAAQSSEAQHEQAVKQMAAELELANMKADADKAAADATLKQAKAEKETVAAAVALKEAQGGMDMKQQAEIQIMEREAEIDLEVKRMELEIKREELALKREEMELKLAERRMMAQAKADETRMGLQAKSQEMEMGLQAKAAGAKADMEVAGQKAELQRKLMAQKAKTQPKGKK